MEEIKMTVEEYNELMAIKEENENNKQKILELGEANNKLIREKADLNRAFINGNFSKQKATEEDEYDFKKFLGDIK